VATSLVSVQHVLNLLVLYWIFDNDVCGVGRGDIVYCLYMIYIHNFPILSLLTHCLELNIIYNSSQIFFIILVFTEFHILIML
jgi:hypothetical protein